MINFKLWLNESISQFTTKQGSTYQVNGQKTIRTKSAHEFHDTKDTGIKQQSEKTIYVKTEFAKEVGWWGSSSGSKKKIILFGSKIHLLSWNTKENKFGIDKIYYDNSFVEMPTIGLHPLELWDKDETDWPWKKSGMEVYSKSHPGSTIIEIS